MKTSITRILTIASVAVLASACDDFLGLEPISTATDQNSYRTASDAEAALIGAYDSFSQEYYIWDNILFSDVISDNHYAGGDNPEIFAIDNLEIIPTNGRLFNNWSQLYNGILKANTVLAKVPGINDIALDDNNRRDQILGEASFLRAYHYFNLVRMHGDVPLITSPPTSANPSETQVSRRAQADVYAQMIEDLEFAISVLPDTYSSDPSVNKARATKGAAHALLAKVLAQQPEADRDYAAVLEHCNAVINSPAGYQLLADYNHLWDGAHYNNAESIIEIQFVGSTEANWGPQLILPPSISGDTWRKFVTPSKNLVAAFDAEGDVIRKNASILFEDVPWADEFWSEEVGDADVPFSYKWKSANGWASTNRQYILRLADIILLKAEALNETDQPVLAAEELDKIRDRAGLDPTTATTKAQLKTAILNERRLELCQEGQRWYDLKRAGVAVQTMNALVEIDLRTNTAKNYNMNENKLVLPIPQAERDRNPNLSQNDGYL